MKQPLRLVCIALFFLIFTGCVNTEGPEITESKYTWSIIKSPQTGRCYEIVTMRETLAMEMGFGYMGMSEIPCPDESPVE